MADYNGDINFVVSVWGAPGGGGIGYNSSPRDVDLAEPVCSNPFPPLLEEEEEQLPPEDPCPDQGNNQCSATYNANGQLLECSCEIGLKPLPRGQIPHQSPHQPLPLESDGNGGFMQRWPRGDGLVVYKFYDASYVRTDRVEVRNVTGAISVYELASSSTTATARYYRLTEYVDPYDNTTRYEYDSRDRVIAVHRPDGISELWNYDQSTLSWIGSAANQWDSQLYTGAEVTYFDNVAQQAMGKFTTYFLFEKVGSQGPLVRDRLFRIYRPKSQVLSPLVGSGVQLQDTVSAQAPRHVVTEFRYSGFQQLTPEGGPPTPLIREITQFVAEDHLPTSSHSTPITVRAFEWVVAGDRYRVFREIFSLFGQTVEYAYQIDLVDSARADQITTTDSDGTTTVTTFDDHLRPTQVVVTPLNTIVGRPRASDTADNGGVVEPTSITTNYTYGACGACRDKPTRVEVLPSGRVTEYSYSPATGLLTSETVPDPAGGSVGVTTLYVWAPLVSGDTYGTQALQSVTRPDGSQFTYTYLTSNRPQPAGSSARGLKVQKVTSTSSAVAQASGSYVVTEHTNFHIGAPVFDASNRQTGLVGFITSTVDGDGVTTAYSHNALGFLTGYTRSGLSESVETVIAPGRTGLPLEIESNANTPYSLTHYLQYNPDDRLATIAATVGSQALETRYYYDMWGNLAIRLEKNQGDQGQAPNDFHPNSPRADQAREWLRSETQFNGSLPVAIFQDRRTLDRNDSGALVDDADARFSLLTFVHDARGLVSSIGYANGATLDLTYDGYGSLYKTELSGPGQPALVTKRFVNSALELVREVRGDATTQLVTEITRNSAGRITAVLEPAAATAPPTAYPFTLTRALREYDYDSMSRVISERLRPQGGAIFRDERTTYDVLGRVKEIGIYEGSNTSASQVYASEWAGVSKLVSVTGPGGRSDTWYYDTLARRVLHQASTGSNPRYDVTVYAAGTDFVEERVSATWDEQASPPASVARSTGYVRDALGRVLQIEHGSNSSNPLLHTFTYYSTGQTASYTDPLGKVEQYLPDAMGRLAERFRPQGSAIWNGAVYTDWSVDARTALAQTDGLWRTTTSSYDFAGRLESVMEPGATTQPTATSPNQSFARFLAYNAASQLTDIYTGNNGHIRLSRDGAGRLIMREWVPEPGVSHISIYYGYDVLLRDVMGQVLESRSGYATGGLYVAELFDRDSLGRTHRERFGYETTGLASNWIDIESSFNAGDPLRNGLKYANNLTGGAEDLWIDHAFDLEARLTGVKWGTSAATQQLAAYKHDGALIRQRTTTFNTIGPATFSTEYTYDPYGRMTRIDHSFDAAAGVEFAYDDASNLVKEKYAKQDGSAGDQFAYDEHNRLLKAWLGSDAANMGQNDPDGGVGSYVKRLTYGMDAAMNRTSVQTLAGSGGAATTVSYTIQSGGPQGPSNRYEVVDGVTLWYDDRGNLICDGLRFYVYDVLNRLIEVFLINSESQQAQLGQMTSGSLVASGSSGSAVAAPAGAVSAGSVAGTLYNVSDIAAVQHARSQILGRVEGGLSELIARQGEPGFGSLLRESLSPSVAQAVAAPSPASAGAFSATGASTSSSSTAPSSSGLSLTLVALYLYDASDRRVIRWLTFDRPYYYAWDGWEEAEELTLDAFSGALAVRPVNQYVWGQRLDELVAYRNRPTGQGSAWVEYFIAEGGAHCPVRVLNGNGSVVEVQEYDPYGQTVLFDGQGQAIGVRSLVGNGFQWKGHRVDWETGLVYMRHRYYNAKWGVFQSTDPLGVWYDITARGNAYVYGAASPLTHSDPLGLQVTAWVGGSMEGVHHTNMGNARQQFQGKGDHKTFNDEPGREDDAIIAWIAERVAAQRARNQSDADELYDPSIMKATPCAPEPVVVTLIGHSLGGAQCQRLVARLMALGISVDFLITLDAVGSVDGLLSVDTFLQTNESGLEGGGETHWTNSYNMTLADAVADIPIPLVSSALGGLIGAIAGALSGDMGGEAAASAGNRQGQESGANVNIEAGDVNHSDAAGFLRAAIEGDSVMREALVGSGILRAP